MPHATYPDLAGRSVFITGGGSGIGAALTEGFLAQGARVAFVQRRDGTAFADEMQSRHGTRPLFIACDIADTAQLEAAMDQAAAAHGPITALVNNAANDQRHRTEDVDPATWERLMGVNLAAYFFACRKAVAMMRGAGGGTIVNVSSISYLMGNAGYPVYVTANAGITGMTRALAREFGPEQIRVNALAPGWVLTEKQLEMWATPEDLAQHLGRQCLKRHLTPEDMVDPVLFLSSQASAMMTSQCMVVDGGVVVTG